MVNFECFQDPGWPFLRQADDLLLKEQAGRKFTNKSHKWVSDPADGYALAAITVDEGNLLTLKMPDGKKKKLSVDETQDINAAKFEKAEDMANFPFLNEASVLHNLRQRYSSLMLYTYSGAFCLFMNPYKTLPIYTDSIALMYVGRRREKMPPHVFAVADESYRTMIHERRSQAIVLTGVSGAGKSENAKRLIGYFSFTGGGNAKPKKSEQSFENRIVQMVPVIEAFGNASTPRNSNSSRSTKLVRFHFNNRGKPVGGDIFHYFLDKWRVVKQSRGERSFHIFYQIISNRKLREICSLDKDIRKYHFVSNAEVRAIGVDDSDDYKLTDKALSDLGFTSEEKYDIYKLCAAVMHIGEMKFKDDPERGLCEDQEDAKRIARLLGVDVEKLVTALLRPSVKVGEEWVRHALTLDQLQHSNAALACALYSRLFDWLLSRCNASMKNGLEEEFTNSVGVLDIGGFETFEHNSFEQLWKNYASERLEQFVSEYVFNVEQEEYHRENLQWQFVDFGHSSRATIDLIDKPSGVTFTMEGHCALPDASETTFVETLCRAQFAHPNFIPVPPPNGNQSGSQFAIRHYAGTVTYSVEGWFEKNLDPLNESAIAVMKGAEQRTLIHQIWSHYWPYLSDTIEEENTKHTKEETSESPSTVRRYREALNNLLGMVKECRPHFVRCLLPNTLRKTGIVDATFLLNQLSCYGILEGARIWRSGFPKKLSFMEFRHEYSMLAPQEATLGDSSSTTEAMILRIAEQNRLNKDHFELGTSKVFFKASLLAKLDEMKDEALRSIVVGLQSACRFYIAVVGYRLLIKQREATTKLQHCVRRWIDSYTNPWLRLYSRLRPLLNILHTTDTVRWLQKRIQELTAERKKEEEARKTVEERLRICTEEFENFKDATAFQAKTALEDAQAMAADLKAKAERVEELEKKLLEIAEERDTLRKECETIKETLLAERTEREKEREAAKEESEKKGYERQLDILRQQIIFQEKEQVKLIEERNAQEVANQKLIDELAEMRSRCEKLEAVKDGIQDDAENVKERFNSTKRTNDDLNKTKRRLESEMRKVREHYEVLKNERSILDDDCKRRAAEIEEWRNGANQDADLIIKLQINTRRLIVRIEELEEELELERRARLRAEKQRDDTQDELRSANEHISETTRQLNAQAHLNKVRQTELTKLHREFEQRTLSHETRIADLCSMQWLTLNNLRNLTAQADSLEKEASRVLSGRHSHLRATLEPTLKGDHLSDSDVS